MNLKDLKKKTQEELSEMCERIGKHPSGTKEELIAKLVSAKRKEPGKFRMLEELEKD